MNKKMKGIWSRKDDTFYYLITGTGLEQNLIDRLRTIMLRKGLLTYVPDFLDDPRDRTRTYKVMTMAEAEERGYNIQPLYLNAHVQATEEAKQDIEEQSSPWLQE